MLTSIHPKLPMRNKAATQDYFIQQLGFREVGSSAHHDYLMVEKDAVQIHFFEYKDLRPAENYGQVYIRTDDIDVLYQALLKAKVAIHPAGHLQVKPWGQKEFSLLDPDNNLLTFAQSL